MRVYQGKKILDLQIVIYVHDVYLTDTLEEIKETTKHMKPEFEMMSWL